MDDSFDKELKEKLSRDPFPHGGFDGRLRRRIEERLNDGRSGSPKPRRTSRRLPAAALAAFAALFLGLGAWLFQGYNAGNSLGREADLLSASSADAPQAAVSDAQPRQYALLIGLRTDEEASAGGVSFAKSRYRTLLVAPEGDDGELRLISDNASLYMPYKMSFWEISPVQSPDGRQTLQAVQATNRKKNQQDASVHVPDYVLSERVEYAGNEYLSVRQTVKSGQAADENRWVKQINQINAKPADPADEPHTALQDVLPNVGALWGIQEQWSITRAPGRWTAETRDGDEIAASLPASVIQHDGLGMSWADIQQLVPGARDAFTYGDMLGVVTDKEIRVYLIRGGQSVRQPVVIPLAGKEAVVMIQWAQDSYVDRWIADMRSLHERHTP